MEIDINNEKENIKLLFAVNNIYLENKSTETIKMNMRGHKESKSKIPK